jgi:hypothetical protein
LFELDVMDPNTEGEPHLDVDELIEVLERLDEENELLRVRNAELMNLLEDAMTVKVRLELRRCDPRFQSSWQARWPWRTDVFQIVVMGPLRHLRRPIRRIAKWRR